MTRNGNIEVEDATELSPHSRALLSAGEAALVSSVETSREFCKSMITISFSSIPIYLALLKVYLLPEATIPETFGIWWIGPIICSLLAAGSAMTGYLPGRKLISLDLIDELERFLKSAANRRFYAGLVSFGFLTLSVIIAASLLAAKGI